MEKTENKGLGRAIRVLRTELGLSRKDMEERTRLSYPYLSEIEAGKKTPSPVALQAITRALEVPEEDLLQRARDIEQGRTPSRPRRHFHVDEDRVSPSMDRMVLESSYGAPPAMMADEAGPLDELFRLARLLPTDDLHRLIDLARRMLR